MLFQSQEFVLLFLPAAVLAYYAAAGSAALRQWTLLAFSLFFYGWWDARFIPLLVGQVALTWLLALANATTKRKAPLYLGIALNLASLGTFKYLDFLLASAEGVLGLALPRAHILLPIGISFFTFQLVSYLVDRLRNDAPQYPFRTFALFVMVFPHLIAGPIVRHNELVPQFAHDPRRDGMWQRIGIGLVLFSVGFGKKVLLSDRLAEIADPLFARARDAALSFGEAWTAALAFSFQLYLDFSAYTEMAIGIALMFGLLLPENFRRPYLATDLRDFWRRWHISLSNFLRDYLYIPLGGSRAGPARYAGATIVTMGLCGLWHGAGWTYVAWGLWHGLGLIACRGWQQLSRPLPAAAGWTLTMAFVLIGWVLFRAADFSTAASILHALIGGNGLEGSLRSTGLLLVAAVASVLIPSAYEIKGMRPLLHPVTAGALAVLAGLCVLEVGRGQPVNFIYFQF